MGIFQRIKKKAGERYRVHVVHGDTYEQRYDFDLTPGRIWALSAGAFLLIVAGTTAAVFFSPIRRYIPGYTNTELRERYANLRQEVHQMRAKVARQDSFISSIQRIPGFKTPDSLKDKQAVGKFLRTNMPELNEQADNTRAQRGNPAREQQGRATPAPQPAQRPAGQKPDKGAQQASSKGPPARLASNLAHKRRPALTFVKPLDGEISQRYYPQDKHFAIDIVAPENSFVKAIAAGFVIFADYTLETGYVIGVQHSNNYISFYKHNSKLTKEVGDYVFAGEPVAVIGNSGKNSTGPHLHFELWHRGAPVNALRYLGYEQAR
jgi:murein DD-endopeptidase MepM/ murein hydrolase activator NlpD